jgi:thymidylate synthase (FAD)
MGTKLLYSSPLYLASNATRFSHDNHNLSDTEDRVVCNTCDHIHEVDYDNLLGCDKCAAGPETDGDWWYRYEKHIGKKDKDLIYRVGVKMGHNTILRFIHYHFEVKFTGKDLLAFSRHCQGIDMVMTSSRYTTVNRLKKEEPFTFTVGSKVSDICISDSAWERSTNFIKHTGIDEIDVFNIRSLEQIRSCVLAKYTNDQISTMLPQAWLYTGQIVINAQALRHLFALRLDKNAHIWMQEFASDLYNALPKDHLYLYKEFKDKGLKK